VHRVDQDVVRIQVAVHHATLVQMRQRTGHIAGDAQRQICAQTKAARVLVTRAALQTGWPRQVDVRRRDEGHQQALGLSGMSAQPRHGRGQRGVLACGQARGQFVLGQTIAGHRPFEQLERQRLRPTSRLHAVDVARRALAQQWAQSD
jgi:hypothetical protein